MNPPSGRNDDGAQVLTIGQAAASRWDLSGRDALPDTAVDRWFDQILRWLRPAAWIGVVVFTVLFLVDSTSTKPVAVAVVLVLVVADVIGCFRLRLLRFWPVRVEWAGAALSGTAVSVAPTASPLNLTLVATGNGIIGVGFIVALVIGIRANGERLRDPRIWLEAGVVVSAVAAWYIVSYGGTGTATGAVPVGLGRAEFSVGPVSLVFVLVLVPCILLLARVRSSRGPTMMLVGFALVSAALLGLNARVGVDSTAALIRPFSAVLFIGAACGILCNTEPSVIRLMSGSAAWRPIRSWVRTAWLLVVPGLVVGGVALTARSLTEALWPLLLLVAMGLMVVRARVMAETQIARQNSGGSRRRAEPPPLTLDDLVDWCRSVEAPGSAGLRYSIIAVLPDVDAAVPGTEDDHLRAEIEQETVRRLRDALRTEHRVVGDTAGEWAVGVDHGRFIVLEVGPADRPTVPADLPRVSAAVAGWLAPPFRTDTITLKLDFGIGFTEQQVTAGDDPVNLIQDAVWAAQHGEAPGPTAFDPERRSAVVRRAQLGARLEDALVDGSGLSLVYEPLVDLSSGRTIGAESLTRWNPLEWGPVSPVEFIPLAESGTSMLDLGEWVMRTACRAAVLAERERLIGVNMAGIEVAHPDLYRRVMSILDDTGMDPALLIIEITETVVGAVVRDAAPALQRLVAAGVRLSMDDFGTESSGLQRVLALPWNSIKLDRSLVFGIGSVESPRASLIRSVVGVAEDLGATIVAEGVEDVSTLEVIGDLGCHTAQGWVFGRGRPNLDDAWADHELPGWRRPTPGRSTREHAAPGNASRGD